MSSVATFAAPEWLEVATARQRSERELVDATLGGDREAAEELAARTYGRVYASLFHLCAGNAELAADLTQETYQRAWRALSTFGGRAEFSTWLYRVAYTTFLNHIRRPRRMVDLSDATAETLPDPDPPADEALGSREDAERLQKAVLELPDDLRFTVTAHFWGGLDVKEIARVEGITGMGVRKRLKKAFAILATDPRVRWTHESR